MDNTKNRLNLITELSNELIAARAEIESLRNQLSTNTPDGWKLVPIEPTEEMYLEGKKVESVGYSCLRIYKAMINVAPTHKER